MTDDELTAIELLAQTVTDRSILHRYALALCREVRRLTAENDELRQRPTLGQVLNAIDNATWRSNESYRESAARVIRQLYAEEQPHD
jgi:hypothetical protein